MVPSAHPSPQFKWHLDRFSPFWATVCKTVHPMLSDRCLSVCLSVTFVHCGQTVGRIKVGETRHAGRPRPWPHCVIWVPRSPPQKGEAEPPQIFGPCLLWPNGWMDEARTSHGRRPQPSRLCVRWGPSPLPKRGRSPSTYVVH